MMSICRSQHEAVSQTGSSDPAWARPIYGQLNEFAQRVTARIDGNLVVWLVLPIAESPSQIGLAGKANGYL